MNWRWITTGWVAVLVVGVSLGQTQPIKAPSTGPGSHGWPASLPAPEAVLNLAPSTPTLEAPAVGLPAYTISSDHPVTVVDAEGMVPLPGSLEDNFNREVAVRRAFRICTWNDYRISVFPTTLIWENGFADKRAPRLQLLGSSLDNFSNTRTLDNSIGTTFSFFRIDTPGRDLAYQLDLFAVVHTRLSPEDLIATDYRFGVPLSAQWGNWRAKLAYEHTSTHLGDEFMRNTGTLPRNYAKDEVVVGLMRDIGDLRVYGQVSYAFFQDLAGDPKRWRYDAGFQWVMPQMASLSGSPYFAAHLDTRGESGLNPNINTQVGWLWRNPFQRLSNLRVFGEYYEGRSQFGQFAFDREKFFAVGIAADF
jgi:Protein of unknown function (DUF1207)